MWKYVIQRLLLMIPILLGVTLLVFTVMQLMPGDPASLILGLHATKEAVEALNKELGLDRPFFVRYFKFITDFLRLDFGKSYNTRKPIRDEIAVRIPVTLRIAILGIIFAESIGITLGVVSAVKQYTALDTGITVLALLGASVPGFWLSMMVVRIFAEKWKILPTSGLTAGWKSYVLPILVIVVTGVAGEMRMTRAQMLDTIRQDYIRTARSKGAPEREVIWKHAFKNASLPLANAVIMSFGAMMGGSVITETVFALPGMGQYMITGIRNKDEPVVLTVVTLMSALNSFLVLVVDIVYAFIDPRIKARYAK